MRNPIQHKLYNLGACCSAVALACGLAPAVFAQDITQPTVADDETVVDNGGIVVTARRREENILDTPVTLSVQTAESLAKLNINNILDLQAYTPGLYAQQTSSGRTDRSRQSIFVRNIRDLLNPTVSVFLDGAPVNSDTLNNLGTEVQRIEVLKGPQSAAFGRQSFAGAINVVTRDPGNDFRFDFDGKFGSYKLFDVRANVEIPIVQDAIGLRIGGRRYGYDGQYTNPFDGSDLGAQSTQTVNATLLIKPFDGLRIKAFGMYLKDHDSAGASAFASVLPTNLFNCNAGAAPTNINNYYCGKIPRFPKSALGQNPATPAFVQNVIRNASGLVNPIFDPYTEEAGLERRAKTGTLAIDFDIPGTDIVLSSLTGYNKTRNQVNQDLDGRDTSSLPNNTISTLPGFIKDPYINYPTMVLGEDKSISQELRLTSGATQRFRWMVGVNYFRFDNRSYVVGQLPNTVTPFTDGALNRLTDKSVFGSASFDFNDAITLNLEGRYIEEELKVYFRSGALRDSGKYKEFTPRVSLQYKFDGEFMGYATYSRGLNKGGFNLSVLPLNAAQRAYLDTQASVTNIYDPAKLDNYEVGLKGAIGRIFTFSGAVFYAKWKDQAITNSIAVPNATAGASDVVVGVTQNTGQSTVKGAEIEGNLKPLDNLTFSFNAGYSKVTLDTDIPSASSRPITGQSIIQSGAINPAGPVFSSNIGVEYNMPISADYRWYIRSDFTHRSRIYSSYDNINWIGDANIVNAATGFTSDNVSLQLYVNNVFNNKQYLGIQSTTSLLGNNVTSNTGNAVVLSMPVLREGGVRLQFHF